jgi:hypothetical protein
MISFHKPLLHLFPLLPINFFIFLLLLYLFLFQSSQPFNCLPLFLQNLFCIVNLWQRLHIQFLQISYSKLLKQKIILIILSSIRLTTYLRLPTTIIPKTSRILFSYFFSFIFCYTLLLTELLQKHN